ncbi:efflux RND transporter permease subunit [Moritella sp. 5]|uniref:efflux RND transporter permease subunit n=1 Tax=Moritella sp. 5 TaxID=2746231 RepID=UPI001BAA4B53|nr:efflux RND transporter permease subunit [Moritella sp. 5]QUM80402.1 efflux RND transporter permease subunit [Moritella sp. 5]
MNFAEFAIKQRTFILFFMVVCIIGGVASYFKLGKFEDPSFTVKTALVIAMYPGASALEVEEQVTDVVEARLQQMETLNRVRSLSQPGMSMVFVDLKESTNSADLPQEWDLLRRKVNDLSLELPPSAQIKLVKDEFSEVYGMLFSIHSSEAEPYELREYSKELQRRLQAVNGIKKVELHGVQSRSVYIDFPPERLAQYGLTAVQVWDQLRTQSSTFYAGSFMADQEHIRVNQSSEFKSLNDVKNLMIRGGINELATSTLRLGDVAEVTMGYRDPAFTMNRYDGEQSVAVAVSPISGFNVVLLGDTIKSVIANYQNELPLGVEVSTVTFQPEEVEIAINKFLINILESALIVAVVLWIFMGFRSASIVTFSLVFTILLTLIFMWMNDISLQRVSLGTFIIALGMLVDNAIVITDMFKSKLNKGIERTEAAISSVKETALPLLGATIIAITGSSPVIFSKTDVAEFALSLFQVMAASLLLSWLVAVVITPLLCWYLISKDNKIQQAEQSRYNRFVTLAVSNPKKVLVGIVPVILAAIIIVPNVKTNFMPLSDRPLVFFDYWLPNGSRLSQTSEDMKKVEHWLLEQDEVESIASFIGESAPRFSMTVEPEPLDFSYGQVVINMKSFDAIDSLVVKGDEWAAQAFPNAEPRFKSLKMATSEKYSLEARFSGPEPAVLHKLADQAKAIFRQNENTTYVRDDWRQKSKVITPVVNQERAREAGVTRSDIAFTISRASTGVPLSQMYLGDEAIPIMIRDTSRNLSNLNNLPVRSTLSLQSTPLGQVVDGYNTGFEETKIWRRNRVRTITAQAGITVGLAASDIRKEIAAQMESIELPLGYSFEWGGEFYDEDKTVTDIYKQLPKAGLVMAIILVAMFNGFKQPLIIIATIPLAATGSALGLVLFDKPYGFTALIGAIALSGMIIKNGIVLMDQIELERKQGKALNEAVINATLNRTMAISMGALTTILGMIPLLGDTLFSPMAATIIGGLLLATVLSLIVMPAAYCLFTKESEDVQTTKRDSSEYKTALAGESK